MLKYDAEGLIPAVVQDADTGTVLMLAYMNRESLTRTLESGETWFWSRSRQQLWHKGAESGNRQKVREIRVDCDADTLLVLVEPLGPACHTGQPNCFFRVLDGNGEQEARLSEAPARELPAASYRLMRTLTGVAQVIAERQRTRPAGSYTAYLFDQGLDKILKKVGEESAEVIIASKNGQPAPLVAEMADLIYHLLVLAAERGVSADEIAAELQARDRK